MNTYYNKGPTGQDAPPAGPPSPRTQVRRSRDRGRYERATIEAILDEGLVCHLAVSLEATPVVLPFVYARIGDQLYFHGAAGNAILKAAGEGAPTCATVTLLDGLVLARSAFHHSVNYRCVVVYGTCTELTDLEEKRAAAAAVVEHVVPGRGAEARPATDAELRATRLVRLPITEASAKMRTGGPLDDPEDLDLPVWAGQVPLRLVAGEPDGEPGSPEAVPVPDYVSAWRVGAMTVSP